MSLCSVIVRKYHSIKLRLFYHALFEWMNAHSQSDLSELDAFLARNGWHCDAVAMDGSEYIYRNQADQQINIRLKPGREAEVESG